MRENQSKSGLCGESNSKMNTRKKMDNQRIDMEMKTLRY
jgi:hypothetical protein